MLLHGNIVIVRLLKKYLIIFIYRCVSQENFKKYGVEYPTNVENETQKPKSSIKKITSFMTPQNQKAKANLSEK